MPLVENNIDERKIFKVGYEYDKYHSVMTKFRIVLTYRCNLRCTYCYQGGGEVLTKTMSDNTIMSTLKFIKKTISNNGSQRVSIVLYGGEPFLNIRGGFALLEGLKPWLIKNDIKLDVGIISNGTLMTEKIIYKLLKYGDVSVQITLDGAKEFHDKRRKYKSGSGTYDKIISTLNILKKIKCTTIIRINIDKGNYKWINELLDDLIKRGFQTMPLSFGLISPATNACASYPLCLSYKEFGKILPSIWNIALEKGFKVINLRPKVGYVFCESVTNNLYNIDPLGDVYTCPNFIGNKIHRVGKIDKNGILHLENPYYDWMARDPLLMKKCRDCKLLPICGGGCPGMAWQEHKTYHAEHCGAIKDLIHSQIIFYLKQEYPEILKEKRFTP